MRAPRGALRPALVGALLVATGSCAPRAATSPVAPPGPTSTRAGPEARRAPGVALDPGLALPAPRAQVATRDGVAVLLSPDDPTPALRVADAYFAAIAAESLDDLERLLDTGAEFRQGPRQRSEPALAFLRRRMERLDYTVLAAELPYRPSEREVITARTPEPGASERPVASGDGAMPVTPRGDDVVVRVPVVARVGTLLGSEVVLLLRRTSGASASGGHPRVAYKIGEILEDFRLP